MKQFMQRFKSDTTYKRNTLALLFTLVSAVFFVIKFDLDKFFESIIPNLLSASLIYVVLRFLFGFFNDTEKEFEKQQLVDVIMTSVKSEVEKLRGVEGKKGWVNQQFQLLRIDLRADEPIFNGHTFEEVKAILADFPVQDKGANNALDVINTTHCGFVDEQLVSIFLEVGFIDSANDKFTNDLGEKFCLLYKLNQIDDYIQNAF